MTVSAHKGATRLSNRATSNNVYFHRGGPLSSFRIDLNLHVLPSVACLQLIPRFLCMNCTRNCFGNLTPSCSCVPALQASACELARAG